MANRYPFNIEWSEEDQEYIATCPAFPGLSAFGSTEEEALREGQVALAGFVDTYKANNMALPEPKVRKVVSGKFQLRLPKSLHHLAIRMAHLEGVSLNSYIADAVRAKAAGDLVGNRVLNEVRELITQTQTAKASVLTAGNPPAGKQSEKTILTANTVPAVTHSKKKRKESPLPKPLKAKKRTGKKSANTRNASFQKA